METSSLPVFIIIGIITIICEADRHTALTRPLALC